MGKYYWLQLKRDFFKRHDTRIINAMENGDALLLTYLKLLCESVDHDGRLRFSDDVPYTPPMMAAVLGTDKKTMEDTVDTLIQLGLMDQEPDGTYVMTKVHDMIGSASDTDGARRARAFRERQKAEKEQGVTETVTEVLRERYGGVTKRNESIKKETIPEGIVKKESATKTEKTPYSEVLRAYNEACPKLPKAQKLTETRKTAIKARWSEYPDIETFRRVFAKANDSSFLTGKNDRGWTADLDWLMTASKFTRVLEGKYDDRETTTKTEREEKASFTTEDFYKAAIAKAYKGQ